MERKKAPNFVSFYIQDPQIYEKLKEIARREGRSASAVISELIEEYVRQHEPGNPQLRLDLILEGKTDLTRPPNCVHVDAFLTMEVACLEKKAWILLPECWRCYRRTGLR